MGLTRSIARLSTDERITIVLSVDPDIAENNSEEQIAAYFDTLRLSDLTVPDTATRVVIRPLSIAERDAAEDRAEDHSRARRSRRGEQLAAEMFEAARKAQTDAEDDEKAAAGVKAIAEWERALDDDDARALEGHLRWSNARVEELALAGLVDPADEVVDIVKGAPDVAREIASAVERVSTLPKARFSLSG